MASRIGTTGAVLIVLGAALAFVAYSDTPEDDYRYWEERNALDRLAVFGIAVAGFGVGVLATAVVVVKGPQFKSIGYCPFCGLEKARVFDSCSRCGKKLEF